MNSIMWNPLRTDVFGVFLKWKLRTSDLFLHITDCSESFVKDKHKVNSENSSSSDSFYILFCRRK